MLASRPKTPHPENRMIEDTETEPEPDFVRLTDLADDPNELSKQLRDDLLRMTDDIRLEMRSGGVGVQQQNQLIQAVKLIRTLNSEIESGSETNYVLNNIMASLPFDD